ncbi:hypothetical protein PAXINDRAFT_13268 [Paxillus involutus ATCC 200175]|uniref:Uncharacterized protein n=1 Tax=Paxillus involutus ATCC 200175 TaxID=664439 RepID=A0A0C9SWI2_PAXIN|nr:hypothetical protein PAXINDRAFT_13268 [Paxillus involutus ATCC 200175]
MVSTRKSNAKKHVAQPVLDAKRKHHTKAEIKANRQRLEEERQQAEQEHLNGLELIANIQDKQALPSAELDQTGKGNHSGMKTVNVLEEVTEMVDAGEDGTSKTSYSSALKPPPSCSPTPLSVNAEDNPPVLLLDKDDTIKCEAVQSLMNLHKMFTRDLWLNVKDVDYGQPLFTQKPTVSGSSIVVKAEPVDIPMDIMIDQFNSASEREDDPIIIDNNDNLPAQILLASGNLQKV